MTNKAGTTGSAKQKLWAVASIGLISLLSVQATACSAVTAQPALGAEQTESEIPAAVQVVEVTRGQMVSTVTYTGDVRPKDQVSVVAKNMGRIEALSVDVGSRVQAGQVIGHLERTALEAQLRQATAAVSVARARLAQMEYGPRPENIVQAQANLDSARERLALIQDGARGETVAQAEAALRLAEAKLAQLKAGPTSDQIEQAAATVRAANNQVYSVQAQADSAMGRMGSGFTPQMKEAQSGAAYEQVRIAEARLAELKAGPTPEQLAQAQAAVDQARATLELARNPFTSHEFKQAENAVIAAEQQVVLAESPYTSADLDVARAPIAQAQANADLVKTQLADTAIVAPIDGIVAERLLSVGALASPQIPVLTVVSSDLEIALPVEETRAGQVAPGLPVSVSVAAYPGKAFDAVISSVAPVIDIKSRAFTVKVAVTDEDGKLKAGMLARVGMSLDERKGVSVLPEKAVIKRGSENSVFAVVDGKARVRKIEVGASDGANVEIKSGLQVGDKVVLGAASLKDGDAVSWQ